MSPLPLSEITAFIDVGDVSVPTLKSSLKLSAVRASLDWEAATSVKVDKCYSRDSEKVTVRSLDS